MSVQEHQARFREAIARALFRPADAETAGYLPFKGDRSYACLRCGAAVADRRAHTAWHDDHARALDER
jgi:hypothetical protein